MGWASRHIEQLKAGQTVTFRPTGNSMRGKVDPGQLCTVAPLGEAPIAVGDIVLCTVRGNQYLHIVKAVRGGQYQIANNHGHINGWTRSIHGRLIGVSP